MPACRKGEVKDRSHQPRQPRRFTLAGRRNPSPEAGKTGGAGLASAGVVTEKLRHGCTARSKNARETPQCGALRWLPRIFCLLLLAAAAALRGDDLAARAIVVANSEDPDSVAIARSIWSISHGAQAATPAS